MQRTAPRITDWSMVPLTFGLEYAELLLGMKRVAITRMCRMGEIPCKKFGRKWLFSRKAIRSFLEGENE